MEAQQAASSLPDRPDAPQGGPEAVPQLLGHREACELLGASCWLCHVSERKPSPLCLWQVTLGLSFFVCKMG